MGCFIQKEETAVCKIGTPMWSRQGGEGVRNVKKTESEIVKAKLDRKE